MSYKGHARFSDANTLRIQAIRGEPYAVTADVIVIATGSKPRKTSGDPSGL